MLPAHPTVQEEGTRMNRKHSLILASAALSLGLACGDSGSQPGQAPPAAAPTTPAATAPAGGGGAPSAEAVAQAEQIFSTRCFTCHGPTGAGDGPGSAGLSPPPRNFHDAAWQASVNDDHLHKIILYGGAAVGKSPAMPGNPDLIASPAVVDALVAHIRSLSGKPIAK
jgi:mono/diheme cytochrome c family protein